MTKEKKIALGVTAGVLAFYLLLAAGLTVWVVSNWSGFYTEEQHLSRIRKRAEKRYLGEGSEYKSLEVYPVYNEEDVFEYALVEFEPYGFLYVQIGGWDTLWTYMYTENSGSPTNLWYPYIFEEGAISVVPDEHGYNETWEGCRVFQDESGGYISYRVSHFKAAGIQEGRRYILPVGIPAVKRGENYIDLISGKEIPVSTDFIDPTVRATFEGDIRFPFGHGLVGVPRY